LLILLRAIQIAAAWMLLAPTPAQPQPLPAPYCGPMKISKKECAPTARALCHRTLPVFFEDLSAINFIAAYALKYMAYGRYNAKF
jgi:hypothetical protein